MYAEPVCVPKAVSSELAPQSRVFALIETELPNQSKSPASGAMSFADWIGSQSCAWVVAASPASTAKAEVMAGLRMWRRSVFFGVVSWVGIMYPLARFGLGLCNVWESKNND